MSNAQLVTLETMVQGLGYESVTDYAIKKMRDELELNIKESQEIIDGFEKKYGMSFDDFKRRFFELEQFGLFDKEDDSMDWKVEVEAVKIYREHLKNLI
ncbi:hypothetical protein [Runella sp.]|jgi:hypothetical protein|uniref:hypothetical protein n=1 Tax=Runella sp. TaxID=1960881 RepID=UPI002622AC57|nr:hypothetical protein [Runella sp.]